LTGVFPAAVAVAAFLAGAVVGPSAQANAAKAKAAPKVRIFRMFSETVYQYAETKDSAIYKNLNKS
jgi:hypothetical protein